MQPALIGYEGGQLRSAFSFLTQPVDPKLFAHAHITRAITRASFHNFSRPYEFLMVFSVKRTENTNRAGRNVRLVPEFVLILRGVLRGACPLPAKNWVAFHACHLVPPMQPALIGYEVCHLRTAFSFLTQPVDPKLFPHALITRAIMRASFHNFLTPYEFLKIFPVKITENTDRA